MNPNFFLTLGLFLGTGYLIGDTRGAIVGGVILCAVAIIVDILDAILNRRKR